MSNETRQNEVYSANEAASKLSAELRNIQFDDETRRGRVDGLVSQVQEALVRVSDSLTEEDRESENTKDDGRIKVEDTHSAAKRR